MSRRSPRRPSRLPALLLALATLAVPVPDARADGTLPERLERLEKLQRSIDERIEERRAVNAAAERVGKDVDEAAELREQAAAIGARIDELKARFDGIATGVEPDKDAAEEDGAEADWRDDVAMIAEPVLDALKDLTERPRQLNEIAATVGRLERDIDRADRALEGLAPTVSAVRSARVGESLERATRRWTKRREEAVVALEAARARAAALRGERSLGTGAVTWLKEFATGRGLTLALAVVAALAVRRLMRLLPPLVRRCLPGRLEPSSRTRYRLVEYSVGALTGLGMLLAVFAVFYHRGDVLLIGVLVLLSIGLALGTRQLLPRFVSEARLLLNMGPVREGERVWYRGLPFRVESVNVFSILRNPELHGVLRVPLAELDTLTSRPPGHESWFPSSRGDFVLYEDVATEIVEQSIERIELRAGGGQPFSVPTVEFLAARLQNLSRGETYGVAASFGLDYAQRSVAAGDAAERLGEGVRAALARAGMGDRVRDVLVEFSAAAASSLDFLIYVTMDASTAASFGRVRRLIQRGCLETCEREGWSIPFAQLTVHRAGGDAPDGVGGAVPAGTTGVADVGLGAAASNDVAVRGAATATGTTSR